jgi:hypothetical protein
VAERDVGGAANGKRAGWVVLVVGLLISLPASALFAIITNVIPLAAVMPPSVRVTGPVEADTRAFVSFGLVAVGGLVVLAQGVHRVARGRWSGRLLVAMLAAGTLALAVGARLR